MSGTSGLQTSGRQLRCAVDKAISEGRLDDLVKNGMVDTLFRLGYGQLLYDKGYKQELLGFPYIGLLLKNGELEFIANSNRAYLLFSTGHEKELHAPKYRHLLLRYKGVKWMIDHGYLSWLKKHGKLGDRVSLSFESNRIWLLEHGYLDVLMQNRGAEWISKYAIRKWPGGVPKYIRTACSKELYANATGGRKLSKATIKQLRGLIFKTSR